MRLGECYLSPVQDYGTYIRKKQVLIGNPKNFYYLFDIRCPEEGKFVKLVMPILVIDFLIDIDFNKDIHTYRVLFSIRRNSTEGSLLCRLCSLQYTNTNNLYLRSVIMNQFLIDIYHFLFLELFVILVLGYITINSKMVLKSLFKIYYKFTVLTDCISGFFAIQKRNY